MTLAPLTTAAALARAPGTHAALAAPAQRAAWPSRRLAAARKRR
jgi:hypothetical protein